MILMVLISFHSYQLITLLLVPILGSARVNFHKKSGGDRAGKLTQTGQKKGIFDTM